MKIYEYLENYFRKKKLESKELKKIPQNYYLDLNELDYRKYMDTKKEEGVFVTFLFFKGISRMFFWMFLFYVISDFMNYSTITELLIKLIYPLLQASLLFILVGMVVDMMYEIFHMKERNNYKLLFYKRLKRYKKNG